MREGLPMVRSCWRFVAVAIIFGGPALVAAQDQLGNKTDLEKNYSTNSQQRERLLSGEEKPGKGAADIAQWSAKYFIYRFTIPTEDPAKLHKDFSAMVSSTLGQKNNRAYIDGYLAPELVDKMKDLMKTRDVKSDRSTVIRAAETLPIMAKLTSKDQLDPIGQYLVELVKDPKMHDIPRLYALKALKETMPIAEQPDELRLDFNQKFQNDRRKRDVLYVDTLTAYIERPIDLAGMSYERATAVYYVRREAISALAHAGAPAVLAVPEKVGKKAEPLGPVAPTLLKVLTQTVPVDAPMSTRALILKDKIEAAVGLCNMNHKNMPEYDPALATYLIGLTLAEFTAEYQKDLRNIKAEGADRRLPTVAWKIESQRLKAGLDVLTKNSGLQAAAKVNIAAGPILDAMKTYSQPPGGKVSELDQTLPKIRPANGKVFKTLPKAEEIKF